jgi:hypothetical protein
MTKKGEDQQGEEETIQLIPTYTYFEDAKLTVTDHTNRWLMLFLMCVLKMGPYFC